MTFESTPTRTFGRFALIRLLGQGGFGEVWLAHDPQHGMRFALKILHQGLMSDGQFVRGVQREAGLTQKVSHPNIVKILEIGEIAGRMYIAMEYIDGPTLQRAAEPGHRWSVTQVVNLIDQVASALDATHAQGVVHRDVKPANILVDREGRAHLVDFGLAHAAMSSIGASANSVGMGTAAYMSPEQAGGQTGDPRADVYSLGVIAYEMLAGRLPFEADTLMGYMMAHQNATPPLPAQFNAGISRDVQAVLLKALEKDPGKRYKSAGAFAAALKKAATRKFRKAKTKRRSPFAAIVAGLAVILLVLGIPTGLFAAGIVPLPPFVAQIANLIFPPEPTPFVEDTPDPEEVRQPEEVPVEVATPTASPVPTNTPEPTSTPIPDDTATPEPDVTMTSELTHTATPEPTDTSTPTVSPEPTATQEPTATPETAVDIDGDLAPAYTLQVVNGSTESGKGKLIVQIAYGNQDPVKDKRVMVYSQKQDISGNWVIDQRVGDRYTDNAGVAEFSLTPGQYIVRIDFAGYNWGNAYDVQGLSNVPSESGRVTQLRVALAQLVVGFRYGDRAAVTNQRVRVYRQKLDVGGNWVRDDNAIADAYTDNSGTVAFNIVPGYYIVQSDFYGYNWGNAKDVEGVADFAVPPDTVTSLIYDLGKLVVGLIGSDGNALSSKRVRVRYQTADASGKSIPGDVVSDSYTDNGGLIAFNLTPGLYVIQIDDTYTFDVPVENAKITQWDGRSATVVSP